MKRWITVGALALGFTAPLGAGFVPNGLLTTFVGARAVDNVPAISTVLGIPQAMVLDNLGNIYLADTSNNRIRRIDRSTGLVTTIAGTGLPGFSGDNGPASQAELNEPQALALVVSNSQNNPTMLYVADTLNNRLRAIDLDTDIITTVAGNGSTLLSNDDGGPAVLSSLNAPAGVAVDSGNLKVFVSDTGNNRVRRVDLTSGAITTVAGTGPDVVAAGVNGLTASLDTPVGLSYPNNGFLYIADKGNGRVRRLVDGVSNLITTVAGTGSGAASGDGGAATAAGIGTPLGIYASATGELLIPDSTNSVLRYVNAGSITTVAGTGVGGYSGDGGPALSAQIFQPWCVDRDLAGNVYVVDGNNCLREISAADQTISTIAGNGLQDNVDPTHVQLNAPYAVAGTPSGDLLVADKINNRVRKVSQSSGLISTLAGNGSGILGVGPTVGDGGPATSASVYFPVAVASAPNGTVYIGQQFGYIRAVDSLGNITHVAGTGTPLSNGDGGPAYGAEVAPNGLCVSNGSLYLAEATHQIRRIDLSTLKIYYVAGANGIAGFANGLSVSARFFDPFQIAADAAGSLYVADAKNNAVRKISFDVSGTATVSTVTGLGPSLDGYQGDGGPAANAALNFPAGVFVDPLGFLYIADAHNYRVRRVDPATGIIDTLVGTGLQGYSGDGGLALSGTLNFPRGLYVGAQGALYIADNGNNAVRKVDYQLSPTPTPVSPGAGKPIAYPSPADKQVCISYHLAAPGHVTVEVYNTALRLAARFESDEASAGAQLTCADTTGLARGAYFFRILSPGSPAQSGKFKVIH
jgi:sugar lactone lactonase YvrE